MNISPGTVTVFDVSQTDGKPLPTLSQNLTASVQNYEVMMEALRRTSPAPISIEPILDGSDGFYSHSSRSITVKEGMSESQTISTTIHEIAHAKLHSRPNEQPDHETAEQEELSAAKDRRTREVEAESIAYAVCQYYGIETADNSFGYIAAWSKGRELAELRSSLETINKTSAALIDTIDRHLAEISAERGMTVNTDQRTEELYLVDHSFYVHLQATDAGWNYTVYDRPSLRQIDGGVLDNLVIDGQVVVRSITEACDQVLSLQGFPGKTVEPIDLDMVNTLQDAQHIKPQEATLAAMERNFLDLHTDSYAIYQLRDDGSCDELHWLATADLQKLGRSVEKQHYELTYADELNQYPGKSTHEVLNDLFYRFNQEHPADFHGHSLSASDMVALRHEGKLQCFYVDRYGFAEVPDFFSHGNLLKAAEMPTKDDLNDKDERVKTDREEKRRPVTERPSLRKQLEQHQRKDPVHKGKVKKHNVPEL